MKGYKTLIVNGALAALPVLDYVANNGAIVASFIGPNAVAVLSVVGLVNMVLRWVTDTPVLKAE